MEKKEKKELDNISDFFYREKGESASSPEKKWEEIFASWLDRVEQEKQMLNLFELKLWIESIEEFFSSTYFDGLVFRHQSASEKNYDLHLNIFSMAATRTITLLKELDFKKDKYFLNFEEFIADHILEEGASSSVSSLKEAYSWFDHFRIFMQNLKTLAADLQALDPVPARTFYALKKLYHRELSNHPILLTLLRKQFIPKMDKIFQPDISRIIAGVSDKGEKRTIGVFFILAFRILKITNYIELHLGRSKHLDFPLPLILALKKNLEQLMVFITSVLSPCIETSHAGQPELDTVRGVFANLTPEFQKVFSGELPLTFEPEAGRTKRRKMLQNVVIISEVMMQELIETTARLYQPQILGSTIFENYVSRRQKSIEVKKKLIKLHTKINDYFIHPGTITPAEVFFDINLFLETDLNYLLYKDWNEFLAHYDHLSRTNFSGEFEPTLRGFQSFLTSVLKDIVSEK